MKRALIVKLGAIGDVIMTVPAAHALFREGYAIDWLCGPAVAPLLRCYSWINVLVADDRAVLHGGAAERLRAIGAVWKMLLRQRYDLLAILYYDARWRIFTLPVRADRTLTLSRDDRARRILPGRHHSAEFIRILLQLPDDCRDQPVAPVRPDTLPAAVLPPPTARRIALIPGGASNMVRQQTLRRWPAERYAELAALLLQRGDQVVLLGGAADTWVREAFAHLAGDTGLVDCIGATTLPEMVSTCDLCDLVVSHDTGPLHLAGLSKAPVLALFGPTEPGSFLPRREGVHSIWGGDSMPCRPCYDGRDFAPCSSNDCMRSISVQQVMAAADAMVPAVPTLLAVKAAP